MIDDVSDGEYTLEAKTNAQRTLSESCHGNNTTWRGLELRGNTVRQVPLPWAPEDCISLDPDQVTAKKVTSVDRSSWKVVEGSHWVLEVGDERARRPQCGQNSCLYRADRRRPTYESGMG